MSNPEFEQIGDITTKVIEECAELIHILCKVQRFGWRNYHPNDTKQTPNYDLVKLEMADVEKRISELKIFLERFV